MWMIHMSWSKYWSKFFSKLKKYNDQNSWPKSFLGTKTFRNFLEGLKTKFKMFITLKT